MRGGNGYVEDWPNARLPRDAIVNVIWEGSVNVIVLDVASASCWWRNYTCIATFRFILMAGLPTKMMPPCAIFPCWSIGLQ